MTQPIENLQASLLDLLEQAPPVMLPPAQMEQLATLVETLLSEIAVALANGEVDDVEDHD